MADNMSKDEVLFWNLFSEYSDAKLVIDDDFCFIEYNDGKNYESFDFETEELTFMFGEKLGLNMFKVH